MSDFGGEFAHHIMTFVVRQLAAFMTCMLAELLLLIFVMEREMPTNLKLGE
jgi:hypothetical protein